MRIELKKLLLTIMSKAILKSAVKEANSSCFFIGYQPIIPKDVKKLRKF
ncbi:cyclic lactone autoinducer peptide [Anaerosacchariphilus polymeriproducens]|uniref:Cyclic lactone autoinducer peptide n=1 Tax=Anaerosacchariphilus polymeriproducens TaxID=1812858 RepID=A0A371AZE2_9FIRM|nr:cyclic lactone autoinducer peptide [Anaerosacchariphilus polymeriproducens]RDU24965.1 cyclic lactone autoinducer peptide [Anaerosacchariphilus polymeriproducens]